jgi:pimeloyl-ACP methyl ester carboxylesterase
MCGRSALAGHSMGGIVAANLAALWQQTGLPHPRALLAVEPGKTWTMSARIAARLEDLSQIPEDCLLLAVAGDRDTLARDIDARRTFREATRVLPANKNYVTLISDDHGRPPLLASHFAPVAPDRAARGEDSLADNTARPAREGPLQRRLRERRIERQVGGEEPVDLSRVGAQGAGVDPLDYYGTWKLLDALTDAAFYGRNRALRPRQHPRAAVHGAVERRGAGQ